MKGIKINKRFVNALHYKESRSKRILKEIGCWAITFLSAFVCVFALIGLFIY